MKKILIYFLPTLIILLVFVLPSLSLAADLVPCGGFMDDGVTPQPPCNFNAFIDLIHEVINFILLKLAIPIGAIMFAYAGFLLVTSGGSTESLTKAKHIFWDAFLGLVFVAGAWLIIKAVLMILGYDEIDRFFDIT
ncbi:hypothetical protein HZA26_03815 [Candidatus Nomurabacteria bacterium]|nr:hypothetical protein [Candidatus Nomurabacteria bacterium]